MSACSSPSACVQAAGAALLTPTSLGLVLATSEPERRHGAVRTWTAIGGLSAAIGPVIGGLLVAASWRWVFLVNVPVGHRRPRRRDGAGSRTSRGTTPSGPTPSAWCWPPPGSALVTFGLVKGGDWGWGSSTIIIVLASAAVLIVAFVRPLPDEPQPAHPTGALRVTRASPGRRIVAVTFSASFGAMLLSIVLWEQGGWGWSALRAGLALAPGPVMVPLVSFLVAGRLIARFGPAVVISLGCLVFGAGVSWWALAVTAQPDYVTGILGGMLLTGIGVGLTLPT